MHDGDVAALSAGLHQIVRRRNPKLLEPISQLSLRREPGMETLPMKRLKRLKATHAPSPPGDWLAVRWHELDEVLKEVFGLQ